MKEATWKTKFNVTQSGEQRTFKPEGKKVSGGGSNLAVCWKELKCVPMEIHKGVSVFIHSYLSVKKSV